MKKVFLYAAIIISICSCTKNSPKSPPPCRNIIPIDTFITNNYTNDAYDMYLAEIYNDSTHPNFNNPLLDPIEIQDVLGTIQAVYNLQSTESNTVFNLQKIHTRKCNISHSLILQVNMSAPEMVNLSNNKIPTGNTSLDNILSAYHFDSAANWNINPFLIIYTPDLYNLIPVEKQLQTIPAIKGAGNSARCYGDGQRIDMQRYTDSTLIDFSYGWGDCSLGCMSRQGWQFKVKCGVASFVKMTY